jgi:hypothetical protein
MKKEPWVRLGIRMSPKIKEKTAERRKRRPPSVMLAADHGIQTRVPILPYALASESTTCSVLSQRVSGGGRNPVTGRVFRTQEAL